MIHEDPSVAPVCNSINNACIEFCGHTHILDLNNIELRITCHNEIMYIYLSSICLSVTVTHQFIFAYYSVLLFLIAIGHHVIPKQHPWRTRPK